MAAPPSINLVRELLLIIRLLIFRNFLFFVIFLIGILAAGYRIYLYVSVNHGKNSIFVNPMVRDVQCRIGVLFLFHRVPLNMFIFKADVLIYG
jgi:hypothetical protein